MLRKKYLPPIVATIIIYFALHFPAGLLENWIMAEVLEQAENKIASFFIIWVLPLLVTIGLIAIVIWTWGLVKEMRIRATNEYQPQEIGTANLVLKGHRPSIIVGKAGGLKFELNTNNKKDFVLEAKVPVQSARFTKPNDIIVRPEYLPVIIECENSLWKQMRNTIFSVPRPRIIVKGFTEKGIIWDEENTEGTDITIEFYPK